MFKLKTWKSHGGSFSLSSCLNCSSTGSILLLFLLPFLYPEVMSGTWPCFLWWVLELLVLFTWLDPVEEEEKLGPESDVSGASPLFLLLVVLLLYLVGPRVNSISLSSMISNTPSSPSVSAMYSSAAAAGCSKSSFLCGLNCCASCWWQFNWLKLVSFFKFQLSCFCPFGLLLPMELFINIFWIWYRRWSSYTCRTNSSLKKQCYRNWSTIIICLKQWLELLPALWMFLHALEWPSSCTPYHMA